MARAIAPASQRFWPKVKKGESCWLWLGHKTPLGYSIFSIGTRKVMAHRWAYETVIGPIGPGLTIDHLCRNRACVNPNHLEPTPLRVNTLRGNGITALNARKTACPNGHLYDYVDSAGFRRCQLCQKINNQRRHLRRREEVSV